MAFVAPVVIGAAEAGETAALLGEGVAAAGEVAEGASLLEQAGSTVNWAVRNPGQAAWEYATNKKLWALSGVKGAGVYAGKKAYDSYRERDSRRYKGELRGTYITPTQDERSAGPAKRRKRMSDTPRRLSTYYARQTYNRGQRLFGRNAKKATRKTRRQTFQKRSSAAARFRKPVARRTFKTKR